MSTREIPFKKLAILSAIVAASPASNTALAQDAPALEEVVVTAQKREESLQDIPIAISTFDSTQLEELNVTSLDDLNGYIPSFQTRPFAADSAAPVIFIRGMGSIDVQTTKDGAVGVYLDGVAMGRVTGLALDVADLERIEVLRGPQGTLYGRNTTAGAINYVTRKPHEELAFKQRFTVGNYNHWASQTDLNVPITDNFYLKLGYMRTAIDGWVENENSTLPDQVDPNKKDNQAATAALRWRATDNFTVDYAFDYSDLEYGNGYYQTVNAPQAINQGTTVPTDKRLDTALLAKGMAESEGEVKGHNLTLAWDLNAVTLKSITGYRELDNTLNQNYLDGLQFPQVTRLPGEFTQTNTVDQEQFSQEFQVIGSAFDDGLEYVAGVFYWKESATETQSSNFGTAGFPFIDAWSVDADAESLAAYGQATWHPNILSQRLGFTLGLRYTQDEREATKVFIQTDLAGVPPPTGSFGGKNDFSDTSGNFVIDYAFTDNVNSFLKYSTGYRAGGFNTRAAPGNFEEGFDPENVQSTELGIKSTLWDQRMTLNASVYYNKYDDLQVDTFVPPVNSRTDNAGSATIKGVEIELLARLSRGFTLDAFYAYMDGEFGEFFLAGSGLGDLSDEKVIPNAPEHQAKMGLEYAFPMTSFGQFTAKVDYLWQDETYSNPDPVVVDSYGLWNARLQLIGVPLPKGEIRVALWGKNLADAEYAVLTTDFSGGTGTILTSQFGMPRTYGMDFIYEF